MGADAKIVSSQNEIELADKLILPGVGHFSSGMEKLNDRDLVNILHDKVLLNNTPILGICLGMQLFANYSHEGNVKGLGWIDAEVVQLSVKDPLRWKIPHMGWNSANTIKSNALFGSNSADNMYYFVHKYHMVCNDNDDILSRTNYSYEFTSAVNRGCIYGTQFHPEKSHNSGLELLRNFAFKVQ